MPHKRVTLNPAGGLPSIELRFGNALFAKYDIFLFDRNGANPQPVSTDQLNSDDVPDIFQVGTVLSDLDQRILFWQAAISVFDNQPNQTYRMTAVISQDGNQLAVFKKPEDQPGPIVNTVLDQDTVRFDVG